MILVMFGPKARTGRGLSEAAELLAKQVRIARPDLIGKGFLVLVTDEDGREVHRVRLDRIP
jgi:hypothetical protein